VEQQGRQRVDLRFAHAYLQGLNARKHKDVRWPEVESEMKGEVDELSHTHWVGIDVAKDSLEVFVATTRRFTLDNTSDGLAQLVTELGSLAGAHVILEATGGFEAMLSEGLLVPTSGSRGPIHVRFETSRRPSTASRKRIESTLNFSRNLGSALSQNRQSCPTQ
jgi:hypothetical protein